MAALQRNFSSRIPNLDNALAPAREVIQALSNSTAHLREIGAVFESQRVWQVSSSLRALLPSAEFASANFHFHGLVSRLAKLDVEALRARDERAVLIAAQHNWFFVPDAPISFAADVEECGDAYSGDCDRRFRHRDR
ncbi:hypothetical protein FQZ97_1163850 [compost metagenome]